MSRRRLSKIIILGDSAVGKTSLLNSYLLLLPSYVDQKFLNSYKATVGADFMEKEMIVDGKVINLEIWDTAGQQKFRSLGGAFYRGADCCVLVYDITNKESFDHIASWIKEFIEQGNPKDPENFPFVLIGNKVDKEEEREVDDYVLREFLLKNPKIKHLTTSAQNRLGVEIAFQTIAKASVQNRQEEIFNVVAVPLIWDKPARRKRCC